MSKLKLPKTRLLVIAFFVIIGVSAAWSALSYSNWTRQQKGPENTSATTDSGPTAHVVQGTVGSCVGGVLHYIDWSMVRSGELIVQSHSETEEKLCVYDYNSPGSAPIRQFAMTQSERSPVVVGDVIYRVKKSISPIQIEARSLLDGAVLWTKTVASTTISGNYDVMTAANGVLYVSAIFSSTQHRIMALRQSDGQLLWMRTIEPSFGWSSNIQQLGAMAVGGNRLYVQFIEGTLADGRIGYRAYDANTGATLWTAGPYGTGAIRTTASPIFNGSTLYAAPDAYVALNASTGAEIWNQPVAGTDVVLSMAFANTRVYYSERRSAQYAYVARAAATGALSWTAGNYNGSIGQTPLVATQNSLLYHCTNNTLRAISTTTGAVNLSATIPTFCNVLSAYQGILYLGGAPGSIDQGKIRLVANTLPASSSITVSVPTCSSDNGSTFADCASFTYGSIITHARTTCTSPAGVKEVRFSLSGPSGPQYANVKAQTVAGSTFTVHAPGTVVASGDWTLSANCVNNVNETAANQKVWPAGAAPSSGAQKLSVYEGSARFTDGETMEVGALAGDANIDWLGSDSIYLRPNTSSGASYFEGISALDRQRLYLSGGVNGKPTLEAVGLGQNGTPYLGAAIAATFDGAGFSSGGGAVYGGVSSCGSGKTCYGGYFRNRSVTGNGLIVSNSSASAPTLQAQNLGGGAAAEFVGVMKVNGDIEADNNTVGACTWTPVSADVCPAGTVASGLRFSGGTVSEYNCCSL